MKRRIVFGCYGPPDWGDANAWAYSLFEHLQGGVFDITFVELLTEADAFYFHFLHGRGFDNPRGLPALARCPIAEPIEGEQTALHDLMRSLAPDLVVAWGVDAVRLLRPVVGGASIVLILTDCPPVEGLIEDRRARDWTGARAAVDCGVVYPVSNTDPDLEALRAADLIICVSALAAEALAGLFHSISGRVHATPITPADLVFAEAERFASARLPFAERDVDVLFAASDWGRRAASSRLVERLCAALGDRTVHLVGEMGAPIRGAQAHGACKREDLFALLGRTKVVVSPARAEAGPSVLLEAAAMGCNVVASGNCGYAALCNEALLATRCGYGEMIERIGRALSRPYSDNRASFLGGVVELVETLAVF